MFIYTYSSDVNAWSEPISTEHPDPDNYNFIDVEKHPVLVGNALYFGVRFTNITMRYNLESCEMSLMQLPSTYDWSYWGQRYMLTTTQEGVLGLVTVDHSKLCMWLRNDAAEVDAGWTQSRVIDLKTLLPHDGVFTSHDVVGVADGLGILFMMVESVLYTIDLKTSMVELYQYQDIGIKYIVPYMSFYTPGTCLLSFWFDNIQNN
jgi:hypothetical protein